MRHGTGKGARSSHLTPLIVKFPGVRIQMLLSFRYSTISCDQCSTGIWVPCPAPRIQTFPKRTIPLLRGKVRWALKISSRPELLREFGRTNRSRTDVPSWISAPLVRTHHPSSFLPLTTIGPAPPNKYQSFSRMIVACSGLISPVIAT